MRISKRLEKYKDMYPKTVKYIAEKFRKNRRCTRCGAPVLRESRMIDYPYQCMNCDEDLYHFEVSPPSKNGHRKATKNGMNRSHSFIFLKTAAFIPRFT